MKIIVDWGKRVMVPNHSFYPSYPSLTLLDSSSLASETLDKKLLKVVGCRTTAKVPEEPRLEPQRQEDLGSVQSLA